MIDIGRLLKTRHIKYCGNKWFGFYCVCENGMSEPCSIKMFNKRVGIPHKLRKWMKHKERF